MPKRGKKEIIKKPKKLFFEPEKSGKRKNRKKLYIEPEKRTTDLWL